MSALRQTSLHAPGASSETLSGTIQSVRFYSPRNAWAVLSVHPNVAPSDFDGLTTVVGSIVNPREGDEYEFTGSYVTDPKYGRQFRAETFNVLLPSTRRGVIRYLASIATGVGEVKAARIVGALGDDCLTRIAADAGALDACTFLTEPQRQELAAALTKNRTLADLCGLVCREGITPALAAKIVARFGDEAVDVVKTDPYRLTEMDGIGFLTADRIAMAVKIAPNAPARIQAAVRHILSEAQNEGNCYLQPADLVKEVPALLGTAPGVAAIAKAVAVLIAAEEVVRDGDDIYLTPLYEAERRVAEWVRAMAGNPCVVPENLDALIRAEESEEAR